MIGSRNYLKKENILVFSAHKQMFSGHSVSSIHSQFQLCHHYLA